MPALRLTTGLTAFRARAVAARSVARPAFIYSRNAGTSASPDPKSPKTSPDSDSPQEQGVKSSRANDDPSNVEQGGSTAKPVSGQGDSVGASEEGGDPAKRDPNQSAESKRKSLESEGMKPLDPANK